jgi:lysozyme family protein
MQALNAVFLKKLDISRHFGGFFMEKMMTKANYPACLKSVLKWEGGYVDHPKDPGGATNYGITRATLAKWRGKPVSKQDVKRLTLKEAGQIYKPRYWDAVQGDNLPNGLDLIAFDGGVNSGPSRGARWLQKGLGVKADGKIGENTLTAATRAASNLDGVAVIQKASAARMGFLRALRTWSTFGRGWARRVADTEATAVAMASQSKIRVRVEADKASTVARNQNKAAAMAPAGGASSGLTDLPALGVGAIVGVAIVIAVVIALKAAQNQRRADAYREKSEEM